MIDADTLQEELEFVDRVIPEELEDRLGEILGREVDGGEESGEGNERVLGNVLGVGEGNRPGSVEVVSESLLALIDCLGSVPGGDFGECWELGF